MRRLAMRSTACSRLPLAVLLLAAAGLLGCESGNSRNRPGVQPEGQPIRLNSVPGRQAEPSPAPAPPLNPPPTPSIPPPEEPSPPQAPTTPPAAPPARIEPTPPVPPAQPQPPPPAPPPQRTGRPPRPGEEQPLGPPAATLAPPAEEPALPDYLHVLDRFDRAKPYKLTARQEQPARLRVTTDNVRRIRLERPLLDLNTSGSISLQIDSQGIEWTPRTPVLELERSVNGEWMSVKDADKSAGKSAPQNRP